MEDSTCVGLVDDIASETILVIKMRHSDRRDGKKRALWIALGANTAFMGAEVVGGLAFNSVALLADAVHMLSDVGGLAVALGAQALMSRPASARHTYGFQRAEVMGALINAMTLVAAVVWIAIEVKRRFDDPEPVAATGVVIIAALGLAVNSWSAIVLSRSQGRSLNMRGAFLHMASDAAGSVAVLVAAAAMIVWEVRWADPAASLLIAVLILWATWQLLRATVHVLMEGVPQGMDTRQIEQALLERHSVSSVHHLHVWSVASDVTALSAHVVVARTTLHDAQVEAQKLKDLLRERFAIEHSTLELECHCCEVGTADGGCHPGTLDRVNPAEVSSH